MEIEDARYAELVAAEEKLKAAEPKLALLPDLETKAQSVEDLEKKIVDAEAKATAAEKRAEEAEAKVTAAEEKEKADALAKERFSKLGSGFKAKLGEFTRQKLESVAGTASEEAWDAELKVIEEATSVARDDGAPDDASANDTFSKDAVAGTRLGGGANDGGGSGSPSQAAVGSVVRGLIKKQTPAKS